MKLKATRLALTLFAALVAVALLPSPAAYAQITAQIHGTVTDPTGAVIPGATIVALNTGTGISTTQTTNGHGFYVVPALAVGRYTVKSKIFCRLILLRV